MLPIISLTSNKRIKIRNFEEDKNATLKACPGLKYMGMDKGCFLFAGDFFLTNESYDLIESFEIRILIGSLYPNTFPIVILTGDKIEKSDDYHISKEGIICFEHTYIANELASRGLRLYDFVNYYLPKFFSWALVKKNGNANQLKEWAHNSTGTKQLYETLLETTDNNSIRYFLEKYCCISRIDRNKECYCGNGKKLKNCHLKVALFLKNTPMKDILNDINLFT